MFCLVEGSGELDVVVVSTDVNGETSPVLPEDGVIPVQEGNRVDVTARAVGFSGVINSAMCTERTNCRRGFLCRSVNKTIVTPSSRFFRYSFNPIIQNDTSNITFTIDSFSKTVALNGELIIPKLLVGEFVRVIADLLLP